MAPGRTRVSLPALQLAASHSKWADSSGVGASSYNFNLKLNLNFELESALPLALALSGSAFTVTEPEDMDPGPGARDPLSGGVTVAVSSDSSDSARGHSGCQWH